MSQWVAVVLSFLFLSLYQSPGMYRNLRAFFVECVVADFKRFESGLQNKTIGLGRDLKNAQTSAVSLYHFSEHIFKEFKQTKLMGYRNYKAFENSLLENEFAFSITKDWQIAISIDH